MTDETTLPEQWQELPEVRELVDKSVGEARAALSAERDTLKRELRQLKEQLQQMREAAAAQSPAEAQGAKKPDAGSPQSGQPEQQGQPEQTGQTGQIARLQTKIRELEAELKAKNDRLAAEVLERGIRDAVAKVGEVHKDAWPDVVARGKALFSIDEQGRPVARDADGNIIYAKDGLAPMDFAEWARKLMAEAPHLFKASSGAGSGAAAGTGSPQGGRPVTITKEQARNPLLYRRAKEKAAKLGSELLIQ